MRLQSCPAPASNEGCQGWYEHAQDIRQLEDEVAQETECAQVFFQVVSNGEPKIRNQV